MTVTVDDIQVVADQLHEALDVYDRFVEEWRYEGGMITDEIEDFVAEFGKSVSESESQPGIALVAVVKNRYSEACEIQAKYVEQAREQGRTDWDQIVEETESTREAIRRVHMAGYEVNSKTGELDYLVPNELGLSEA